MLPPRAVFLAAVSGVGLLLVLSAVVPRAMEKGAPDAAGIEAILRDVVLHGPGVVTLVEEPGGPTFHLTRSLSRALKHSGLEGDGVLRFRLPPGVRLVRVEGPDSSGVPLCRAFQCQAGDTGWSRWVLVGGWRMPEIWVTLARTGDAGVRIQGRDGQSIGPLTLPTAPAGGH
jgi:hypothetical protein